MKNWAKQLIENSTQGKILKEADVVDTAWSKVVSLSTENATYYVKKNPPGLTGEGMVLKWLHGLGVSEIPGFVAENSVQGYLITKSCGDESLRDFFDGGIDSTLMKSGISIYADIMRLCESKVDELLALGIVDWRLKKLPSIYNQLVDDNREMLQFDGMTVKEIEELNQLKNAFKNLCEELENFALPETLNHCDIHANNILIDKKTNKLSIIDWPEVVITHPFLSLNGLLWNAVFFSNIQKNDATYHDLQKHCVSSWKDFHNEDGLLEAFEKAYKMSGVYAALVYMRLHLATQDEAISTAEDKKGAVSGCLRTFIESNN